MGFGPHTHGSVLRARDLDPQTGRGVEDFVMGSESLALLFLRVPHFGVYPSVKQVG